MEEINKYLAEAMGECWHEFEIRKLPDSSFHGRVCCHCGDYQTLAIPMLDFSTWEGFGKLWEFAIKQEWWNDFINSIGGWTIWVEPEKIIHPETFAKSIAQYLQEREGK
jgi:hypothetical protein